MLLLINVFVPELFIAPEVLLSKIQPITKGESQVDAKIFTP